jgi:hypothetical protein
VTFSDPGVVKLMNEQFVCAWINKTPQTKFRDGMYAQSKVPMGLPLGTGVNNVTAVFAAADGTVVHAMPGYLDVVSFKHHLEFARDLHARLFDGNVAKADRAGIYADAHRKAAKETKIDLEREAHELQAPRFMRVDEMSLKFFDRLARNRG